jgi:hypothetical protein
MMFAGPRTIIDRLAVASAARGEILPIPAPFLNATYNVQFYGPTVECSVASDSISAIIAARVQDQMRTKNNVTQVQNAYFAYVPDLDNTETAPTAADRLLEPARGSNQLWLSFRRNGTGYTYYPVPTCPVVEYRVCQLYNTSYDLNITFVDGNQTVSGPKPAILNKIDYPITNSSAPSDPAQHSYSAFFWVFSEQLIGTMGFYNNTITNASNPRGATYTQIQSTLQATSLLGTSDLDCFFQAHHIWTDEHNITTFTEDSPQRIQDINLAKGKTLDELIPELAFNITTSFMSSDLLA